MRPRIVVMAKAPAPGLSKTRLCPPLTPELAAEVAEACLADTLRAVIGAGGPPPALVLDGEPGAWLPAGFEVIPQRGAGLAERLAAAFDDVRGPALLIGMDTPQIRPGLLRHAADLLADRRAGAVFGPAFDGGWWALGLRDADPSVFLGVPMSTPFTGALQRLRLADLGLRYRTLPVLRDVDRIDDALSVAAEAPGWGFASALRRALREAALARAG